MNAAPRTRRHIHLARADVGARLVLQHGDRFDEVAPQQLGVAPGERELLARDDDLAHVAELLREAGVLVTRLLALGQAPAKLS